MIRLYRNIILFLLPILILIIFLPVNERSKFLGLKDDCFNHGIWIHDRIYENEKPVDIAFFGTSKTINGINDEWIEKQLSDKKVNVVNLGYCRLGRNFSFTLFKKMLKNKQPKHLIIEVREDENRYGHPIFPYICNTSEVLFAPPFFNRDIVSDMFIHFSYKIELTQDYLYNEIPQAAVSDEPFGFSCSPDTASREELYHVKVISHHPKSALTNLARNFHMQLSRTYLKKIHAICAKDNIEISFLYIPSYGAPYEKPLELESYELYGNVFFPPERIFENPDNWFDEDHFNQAGAEKLSKWIATKLSDDINQKAY
jgi:hypothetical protein